MSTITWSVTADLNNDGTYETDLTGYVEKPGNGLAIDRGVGLDGQPKISQLSISLSNRSGAFTPEYPSGTFYQQAKPGVPIRITATHNSIGYTLWTGYLMKTKFSWRAGAVSMAPFTAQDLWYYLANSEPVNVTASTTRTSGTAIQAVATAVGLVSGDLSLDTGQQSFPMHFVVGQTAGQAILDAAFSELGAYVWITAMGKLRFQGRNSRLGLTASQTWGDGTTIVPFGVDYEFDPDAYTTSVTARSTVYRSGQADTPIFAFSQNMFTRPTATSMALAAGEVYERTFQANSAYLALTSPVAVTDYTANSAIDGTGTDQTASLEVTLTDLGGGRFTIRLRNTSVTSFYVTKFGLRGQPVQFYADRAEAVFTKSVPGMKAGKGAQFDVAFAGDTGGKMRDYAYQEMRVGRYPYPVVRLSFDGSTDTKKVALLSVELGDMILYKNTGLGIASAYVNDYWYVEGVHHDIPPDWAGQNFRSVITLVPAYVYRNVDAIEFDTFTRANAAGGLGTSFSGAAWADSTGFDISSNAARANTNTASIPSISVGKTDMVVEVSLANIAADADAGVGLSYRKTDTSNYWRAYVDKSASKVKLDKVIAGVVTNLAQPVWTATNTAELRAIVQGNRHRVWLDGRVVIDVTDSALNTATLAGLYGVNASGTVLFSDWYAEGLN